MTLLQTGTVSVVMPAYNAASTIVESVRSCLLQDLPAAEIIIVDDCSTDGTRELISGLIAEGAPVKLISNKTNVGVSRSLNTAVDLASGNWIARLDADDVCLKRRFSAQVAYLSATGLDICGSSMQTIGSAHDIVYSYFQDPRDNAAELLFDPCVAHPAVMARADVFKSNRYLGEWGQAEDYEFWNRLSRAGYQFGNLSDVLVRYRISATQISTAKSEQQRQVKRAIRRRYWSFLGQDALDLIEDFADRTRVEAAGFPAYCRLLERLQREGVITRTVASKKATSAFLRLDQIGPGSLAAVMSMARGQEALSKVIARAIGIRRDGWLYGYARRIKEAIL